MKIPKKHGAFDFRHIVTVCSVLVCAVLLIAAAVALASCGAEEQNTPAPTSQTTPGSAQSSSKSGTTPSKTASPVSPDTPAPTGSSTQPTTEEPASQRKTYLSPSSLCVDNGKVYVADETGRAVYRFSSDGKNEKSAFLDAQVNKVLCKDGKVYVLAGESGGKLIVMNGDLVTESVVAVGHTPTDLLIEDGAAYICNRFSNTVSVVDLSKGEVIAAIPVSREPVCLAGAKGVLYVGSRLQDGSSLDKTVSSKICRIDMNKKEALSPIALQDGATNVRAMAVSADGASVYVTHTVARYAYPTMILDRGWVNTNGFSVIDTATGTPTAYLLDDVELGAANPWDVEISGDGSYLIFSISGTGELIKVDLKKMNDKLALLGADLIEGMTSASQAIDHIEFLSGAKTRLTLPGEGVRDIVLDGSTVYAGEYFSGTVSLINAADMTLISSFSVGEQPEKDAVRTGQALWFDARYCYQSWESCSSCHPDARPDGLNWDEGGDGWGTPKNTKSMMFSFRTPPVLATGVVDCAEDNVIGTVREAFHSKLDEKKVEYMNEFLRSLLPVSSPYLDENGGYTEAAMRGKELFEKIGCASCHPAPYYSDMKAHPSPYIGTDGTWENRSFITPTLVELWRSAPYTYCGCVTDLKEIITKFSRPPLTDGQISDIEQFLLSIGTVGEDYGVVEVFGEREGKVLSNRLFPGEKLKSLTFIRQNEGKTVKAPKVLIVVCDAENRELETITQTFETPDYGVLVTMSLNYTLPDNFAYLTVRFLDGDNNDLSSPLKLAVPE